MNRKILVSTFAVLVAIFVYAFGKEANTMRVEADYCITLNIPSDQTEALISELDKFSSTHRMVTDKSSPVSIVYRSREGSEVIILRVLFGDYGSVLSHYSLKEGSNKNNLLKPLKSLVRDKLDANYIIKKCSDIEGFKTPEYVAQLR